MRVPDNWQNTIIVLFFATLIASMTVGAILYPAPPAQFFVFALLNSEGTITPGQYFPSGNTTVKVFDNVTWTVQAQNHMKDVQYVEWRVKLLNSTQQGVDAETCSQSPVAGFFSTRQLIAPGSEWDSVVDWSIVVGSSNGALSVIDSLIFNGTVYNPTLRTANPSGFQMLFELWYFNPVTSGWSFSFQQNYNGAPRTECWYTRIAFHLN